MTVKRLREVNRLGQFAPHTFYVVCLHQPPASCSSLSFVGFGSHQQGDKRLIEFGRLDAACARVETAKLEMLVVLDEHLQVAVSCIGTFAVSLKFFSPFLEAFFDNVA